MQDGVYILINNPDTLYLGTIRTSGAGSSEDTLHKRFVYNYYNRVTRYGYNYDDGEHTYALDEERIWNNNAADTQIGFVVGVPEDAVSMSFNAQLAVDTSGEAQVFISDDGDVDNYIAWVITESIIPLRYSGSFVSYYGIGYHYVYLCEMGNETDTGGIFDYGELNLILSM